jgi:hypothetical protein
MGAVRGWEYDAVIAVGAVSKEGKLDHIDGKVTWIGMGARKTPAAGYKGPLVTFDHFVYFGTEGPCLQDKAPHLAQRFYVNNARRLLQANKDEEKEIAVLLKLARSASLPPLSGERTGLP